MMIIEEKLTTRVFLFFFSKKNYGSGGIRTHASEETGALNQRLRPLGHATFWNRNPTFTVLITFVYACKVLSRYCMDGRHS